MCGVCGYVYLLFTDVSLVLSTERLHLKLHRTFLLNITLRSDRQTGRQTDQQRERQIEKQTGRQRRTRRKIGRQTDG